VSYLLTKLAYFVLSLPYGPHWKQDGLSQGAVLNELEIATPQCGRNEGKTAQLLSMSVIAGWSIYEGSLTNILQTENGEWPFCAAA